MQEKPRPVPAVLSSVGALSGIIDAVPHPIFVSAFLALAGVLDLPVVAEGIGTAEAMNSVIDKGCVYGQGFCFAEALPAHLVPELLKHLWIGDPARSSAA